MLFFILGLSAAGGMRAQGQEKNQDEASALSRVQPQNKAAEGAAKTKTKAEAKQSANQSLTPEEAAVAAEMRTRVFHAPDWVSYPRYEVKAEQSVTLEALKDQGIPFPKGSEAFYHEETGHLIVTNTPQHLDEVQQLIGSGHAGEATVVCLVTVIEGPAELIRQAQAASAEKLDATASLATLLGYARNAGAKVRVVGDCVAESLSDKPAKAEAVCEYALPQPLKLDGGSRVAAVPWETRQVGLRLGLVTQVGADLKRLDTTLNLELHPTPPGVRQARVSEPITGQVAEFPVGEVNTVSFSSQFSVPSGTTRLIGVAKPARGAGSVNEDTLWAAFTTFTTRLPGNAGRLLEPTEITPSPPPPPGMRTVLFQVPQGLVDPWQEDARPDQPAPSLRDWMVEKGILFPPGASVEHEKDVLRMTNTPQNIGRLVALLEPALASTPRTTALTLHTFQAPAAFLRELAHRSTATGDDAAMLAAVEQAVERGEAACLDSSFLETKRDCASIHEAGYAHSYLSKFSSDAQGRPALVLGRRHVGSSFKVEVGQQDHASATFDYTHELHTAAPAQRRMRFHDPATQKAFELSVTDFHMARTSGSLALASGSTRLLALHAPVGPPAAEPALLCATFLRADAVPQACRHTHEAIAAQKEKQANTAAKLRADPDAWGTRTFRVPADFLAGGSGPPDTVLRKIFEGQGVAFPEGAVISYNRHASTVFFKNTRANLAVAETYLRSILSFTPATVVISAQVLEGPGPLLRKLAAQASSKNDHRMELDALLAAVKAGTSGVRHVDMLHIEGKSGTPINSGHGSEQTYLASVTTDEKGATVFQQEKQPGGFHLQVEPVIGADGYTVHMTLNADLTTAPPFEHREKIIDTRGLPLEFPLTDHHCARITTTTGIPHHHARLVQLWKPGGNAEFEKNDLLQVLFITCDVMRDGGVE